MVKIWEEKEAPKKEYFLRLMMDGRGVVLCIVDEGGDRVDNGKVVTIGASGIMDRHYNVNPEAAMVLGLMLSEDGRIKTP